MRFLRMLRQESKKIALDRGIAAGIYCNQFEYPHPVLLFRQEMGIIGNQVQILSDPVTVSDESAANAIAKARRRGGQRRASQETCWVWCG